jgi:hypothetical protein
MVLDAALRRETPKRPDLPASEPYRCNHCQRHRVAWNGAWWLCSPLLKDPDTGEAGCLRFFAPDVYSQGEPT